MEKNRASHTRKGWSLDHRNKEDGGRPLFGDKRAPVHFASNEDTNHCYQDGAVSPYNFFPFLHTVCFAQPVPDAFLAKVRIGPRHKQEKQPLKLGAHIILVTNNASTHVGYLLKGEIKT